MRNAVFSALTVEIVCRDCGEAQTNPKDETTIWTIEDVRKEAKRKLANPRLCQSCDEPYRLDMQNKALIEPEQTDG